MEMSTDISSASARKVQRPASKLAATIETIVLRFFRNFTTTMADEIGRNRRGRGWAALATQTNRTGYYVETVWTYDVTRQKPPTATLFLGFCVRRRRIY